MTETPVTPSSEVLPAQQRFAPGSLVLSSTVPYYVAPDGSFRRCLVREAEDGKAEALVVTRLKMSGRQRKKLRRAERAANRDSI